MPFTDPRSLSAMLGVVVRIAQRIGLYLESANVNAGPLEGELRRRLWFALVAFDGRISEMSDHKEGMSLAPTWDCHVPSNVNDSDLRPEMKTAPIPQSGPSDAIFAVVRAEMGSYIRKTNFHLDFTNPALKKLTDMDKLAKKLQSSSISDADESEVDELERRIESKYLSKCDEDIPLHFMTKWYARGWLARCRLIEFYAKCAISPGAMMAGQSPESNSSGSAPTEEQRQASLLNSMYMLECDSKIMYNPLCKGYLWLMDQSFPILAYFQLIQHLRRRPLCQHAQRAWDVMDKNFEARFIRHHGPRDESGNPFVHFFAKVVLAAWAAREMAFATQSSSLDPLPPTPKIVEGMRKRMAGKISAYTSTRTETLAAGGATDPFLMGVSGAGIGSGPSPIANPYSTSNAFTEGLMGIDNVGMDMTFDASNFANVDMSAWQQNMAMFDPNMANPDFWMQPGGMHPSQGQ